MFFVGTAAPEAHLNVSNKGTDTLWELTPDQVAWLAVTVVLLV